MKLQSNLEHPHGLTDQDYDMLFTKNKPIIFAFHGYPSLIHQLTYKRQNDNIHVHGYIEEGTINDIAKTLKDIKNTFKYRLMLAKNMKNNKKNYK